MEDIIKHNLKVCVKDAKEILEVEDIVSEDAIAVSFLAIFLLEHRPQNEKLGEGKNESTG